MAPSGEVTWVAAVAKACNLFEVVSPANASAKFGDSLDAVVGGV